MRKPGRKKSGKSASIYDVAREAGVSVSEIVRQAIQRARLSDLLESTKGTWRQGDGLRYQRRVRAEWR